MQYQGDKSTAFCYCPFLPDIFLCLIMGQSSVLALSADVLILLLHNMDLLNLCMCDKHLHGVKSENMKEKLLLNISVQVPYGALVIDL